MLGCSETTFYAISVYLGAAGVRRAGRILPAALIADARVLLSSAESMLQSLDPGSAAWQAVNDASATLRSVITQETPTQSEVAGAMAILTQAMAGIY